MPAEQGMTQAITQAAIEATKTAIRAVRETYDPVNNARPMHTALRSGESTLKQPTFDLIATDKYQDLYNLNRSK